MQNRSTTEIKNPIPLYPLFTADAISLVGNVFSLVAIAWFVLQNTGSTTDRLGILPMFIGLAITYFITTISMAFIPAMKQMNRTEAIPMK